MVSGTLFYVYNFLIVKQQFNFTMQKQYHLNLLLELTGSRKWEDLLFHWQNYKAAFTKKKYLGTIPVFKNEFFLLDLMYLLLPGDECDPWG